MPFQFKALKIRGVVLIKPRVFTDERGFFMETYKYSDFAELGIKDRFVQDNHSKSLTRNVIRGLHFQKDPMAQSKLVWAIAGSIFDVAVDIRKNSPTYGKWASATLSANNKEILYIPRGFAHGYCTLEDNTEIIYKCSNAYSSEHEHGIIWNDADINIEWPVKKAVLSAKDRGWPSLKKADNNFVYE